jgi:hypothetical protein
LKLVNKKAVTESRSGSDRILSDREFFVNSLDFRE